MADRQFYALEGSLTPRVVVLTGTVTLGSGGAIAASGVDAEGFSVVKTGSEAGRYTVTLNDAYPKFRGAHVSVRGATDAAYTTANGLWHGLTRNVAVSTTRTLDLQLQRTDTGADAEAIDNAVLDITLVLANTGTA